MAYDADLVRRASARLAGMRKRRMEETRRRRREIFQRSPELERLDRQLLLTVREVAASCLRSGRDPGAPLQEVRERNLALQARQAKLLEELGYPADALDERPECRLCGDTGWKGTQMCGCLRSLCIDEQLRSLREELDIDTQSFDSFFLDWYSPRPWPGEAASPRSNMELVYEGCLNYAQKFPRFYVKNLFLTGDPGLGKTFLSACIARTVAEDGAWVIYESAIRLFSRFEEQKFARDRAEGQDARDETRRYLRCDLLILDDLGSELTTPFVQSALYELVNSRLMAGRHTVISSNLTMDGVRGRYNGQTASRLEGEYQAMRFYGEDIRLKRKENSFS